MNDKKRTPGVEKAFEFISAGIQNGTWPANERMPSTKILAAKAGVGVSTMAAAIPVLKAQGFINGLRRGYLRAGSGNKSSIDIPELASRWQLRRAAFEKDILAGVFAHQTSLPSLKELQSRYGACFVTMKKILNAMVTDGVLRPLGKSFEVINHARDRSSRRIVFITNNFPAPPRSALNPGEYRVIDTLERECVRRELQLDLVKIDLRDFTDVARNASQFSTAAHVLGFVLDMWWYESLEMRDSYLDILRRFSRSKKPVAILDELCTFALPIEFTGNPLFQVFRIQDIQAGARMARMLMNKGHTAVAYLSSNQSAVWSRQRLAGIEEEYTKAGLRNGVSAYIGESPEDSLPLTLALSNLDTSVIHTIFSLMLSKNEAQALIQSVEQLRKNHPEKSFDPAEINGLRREMAILEDAVKRRSEKDFLIDVYQAVIKRANMRVHPFFFEPLFEKALSRRDVTAWICENDIVAFAALSFLRRRKVDVPGDISVAGFDNLPMETLEYRLTSFDFNAPGFMYRMVDFILRPSRAFAHYRHFPVEIEGIIMDRETTGRANIK